MADPNEESRLLPKYEPWLRARRSKRTSDDRLAFLHRAHRQLPWGIDEADEDEIAQFLAPYGGWTRATYDGHLRSLYSWALKRGKITLDPMADLERPGPGPRIPHPCTDAELAIALTAPAMPWRRAAMLGGYAALRCMEIVTVTTDDIIGDRLRVAGKGGKYRLVPIHPALAAELDGTPPGLLCVNTRGGPISPHVLTQEQRRVWRKLGLGQHVSLHSFRHWCATRMLQEGADIREVQTMLGHASVNITQWYTQVTDVRLTTAVGRLPRVTEPAVTRLGDPVAA